MIRDVDAAMPAGAVRDSVIDRFILPMSNKDFAIDLDGNGKVDDQFGNFIGTLATQALDIQANVDGAAAAGSTIELLQFQTRIRRSNWRRRLASR